MLSRGHWHGHNLSQCLLSSVNMVGYGLIKAELLRISFFFLNWYPSLRPVSGPLSLWCLLAHPSLLVAGLPSVFSWFLGPQSASPAVHVPVIMVVVV